MARRSLDWQLSLYAYIYIVIFYYGTPIPIWNRTHMHHIQRRYTPLTDKHKYQVTKIYICIHPNDDHNMVARGYYGERGRVCSGIEQKNFRCYTETLYGTVPISEKALI